MNGYVFFFCFRSLSSQESNIYRVSLLSSNCKYWCHLGQVELRQKHQRLGQMSEPIGWIMV